MIKGSKDLFDRLKQYLFEDLEESPRHNDQYDCYSHKSNVIIEVKCRRIHYDELMIERTKYKFLMDHYLALRDTPIYINATPYGVWLFNLSKIEEPQWVFKNMPKSSAFKRDKRIKKAVGFIHLDKGVNITSKVAPEWDGKTPLVQASRKMS
jgi:hypothetical protein